MTIRIGKNQLRQLMFIASSDRTLLTPDKVSASLVQRGLFSEERGKHYKVCRITPNGLRTLADEMEAGRVGALLSAMRKEHIAARKGKVPSKPLGRRR